MVEWDICADGRLYKLSFPLQASETTAFSLAIGTPGDTLVPAETFHSIARKRIIELAIPFQHLNLNPGQGFTMSVLVTRDGMEQARYPSHESVTLQVPTEHFDAMMWRV